LKRLQWLIFSVLPFCYTEGDEPFAEFERRDSMKRKNAEEREAPALFVMSQRGGARGRPAFEKTGRREAR